MTATTYNLIRVGHGTTVHAAMKGDGRALCGQNNGRKVLRAGRVIAPLTDWSAVTCGSCKMMHAVVGA